MDQHLASLDRLQDRLLDLSIQFGPKLLTAIVILVIGGFAGRWAARIQLTNRTP